MLRRACCSGVDLPQPCPGMRLRGQHFGRNFRINARAVHFQVQLPVDGQDRIANFLGTEPPHVEVREQIVGRIRGQSLFAATRRHLIRAGEHDQPVQRLEPPARLDQFAGQPIEQLRMRRRRAQVAEIVRRTDDAAAEMMLPDAIGHHPGRELVVRRSEPIGQLQTPAAGFGSSGGRGKFDGVIHPARPENPAQPWQPGACGLPRSSTNISGAWDPSSFTHRAKSPGTLYFFNPSSVFCRSA